MAKQSLTVDYLKSRVSYDPNTGDFTHLRSFGSRYAAGDIADTPGHCQLKGYKFINLLNEKYLAHRVVWLYVHGRWPVSLIDHMNGDRGDNRLSNLRESTAKMNMENRHKAASSSKTGVLGVCPANGRYRARIRIDKKMIHIGMFDSKEDAHEAYLKVKRELHMGCTI